MFSSSLFLVILAVLSSSSLQREDDICSYQVRRRYLELGESGAVTAQNVTYNSSFSNVTARERCLLEIITCPSCVVNLIFRHLNLTQHCEIGNSLSNSLCRCDYIWISEPPYEEVSGVPFCGTVQTQSSQSSSNILNYRSKTRALTVAFLFREPHRHAFTLEYSAEHNRQLLLGSTGLFSPRNLSSGGTILSPFFPKTYPRDLVSEYVITCLQEPQAQSVSKPTTDSNCRIRIIFTDFQVAPVSVIEFYDGNYRRVDVTTGTSFRPPIIFSSGPSMTIRFFANGGNGLGFKALYSFVLETNVEENSKPVTDCGGFVENFGGAITMMNMAENGVKNYDCVWLIRPPTNFLRLKTHLYLKVTAFKDFAGNTELQIRQGLTSDLPILETLRYPLTGRSASREFVIAINTGFYVRLRGSFGPSSCLAIAYTSFSYNKCFPGSEFPCENNRCIPNKLSCDGFDHCGDNSDEPSSCYQDWEMQPSDRRWNSHTPNYYFPKMERYPDLKMATLLFVFCSLGLILLISAMTILLYRMGFRARQQRDLHGRLQTISELLDDNNIEDIMTLDEPPGYEPPPDYDDVMKQPPRSSSRRKKKRKSSSSRRSRSSPGERRSPVFNSLHDDLCECGSASGKLTLLAQQSPTSDSQSAFRSEQPSTLPDSPPPPYSPKVDKISFGNRVASEGNLASLSSVSQTASSPRSESRLDSAGAHQSWCPFTDDVTKPAEMTSQTDSTRLRALSAGSNESRSPNLIVNRGKDTNLRRSRSYSENLSSLTARKDGTDILETDQRIVQLDVAIKNELRSLVASCSNNQSPKSRNKFLDQWGKNPFESVETYLIVEKEGKEIILSEASTDDSYWEEFDKQFQNPVRKFNRTFRKGVKVAMLSRKFLRDLKSEGCDCKGACGCASRHQS